MALDILNITTRVRSHLLGITAQIRDALAKVYITRKQMDQRMDSYSGGLLINGTGILGSEDTVPGHNTLRGFRCYSDYHDPRVEYIDDPTYLDGVPGGFSSTRYSYIGLYAGLDRNQVLSLDPKCVYRGGGSVITSPEAAAKKRRLYVGHSFVDYNGLYVRGLDTAHYGLAKLAQDLVLGTDTHMYITREGFQKDTSGNDIPPHTEWGMNMAAAPGVRRGPVFWDHHYFDRKVDPATGEEIPFTRLNWTPNPDKPAGFGYSKHAVYNLWENGADFEYVGNHNGYTDVYRVPIKTDSYSSSNTAGARHVGEYYSPTATPSTIPEGTWCSRNWTASSYHYVYIRGTMITDPNSIYRYKGYIGGRNYSGLHLDHCIPPGAAGARFLMLCTYGPESDSGDKQYHSNLNVYEDPTVTMENVPLGAIPEHHYDRKERLVNGVAQAFTPKITKVDRINY